MIASYLINHGHNVESMLYLSPDEADEFTIPLGTFSMQYHFQADPVSPVIRLGGVDIFMSFSKLNGKTKGVTESHGATVSKANINKMTEVLKLLGPYANKLFIQGKWNVTETEQGYKVEREDENPYF